MLSRNRIAVTIAALALGAGTGLACDDSDRNSNDDTERPQETSPKGVATGGTATEDAVPPSVTETVGTLPSEPPATDTQAP